MSLLPLASPAGRLLAAFLFAFTLFLLYAKAHFYRDPGSIFYDQSRAYERRYSARRLLEVEHARLALQYGSNAGARPAVSRASETSPELCIGMTTSKRLGLDRQYVEDSILSMVSNLTIQERSSIHISLMFTDVDPTTHPTWRQPWLRQMADDVWSYDTDESFISPEVRSQLRNLTSTDKRSIKASIDYTLSLERCLTQTSSPYIAVFEGDILLAPGWVAPALQALRSAPALMRRIGRPSFSSVAQNGWSETQHDWLDMRLFNQERSTGWASQQIGGNNEAAIIAATDLILISLTLYLRRRGYRTPYAIDNSTLAVLTLLIVPTIVITFFQCGKASLLPPSPGLRVANFGCCSQALVYNRKHVGSLIGYLRDMAGREAEGAIGLDGYDMRTRDYARESGLERLALYPMMAQHIGVKSALGTAEGEARSVWSMAFEDLEEGGLRRMHDGAMSEVFGKDWGSVD